MPTYAYACTACEHRFDVQQSFTDDALTVCPECDGRLRKVFASVGVVFKGSGFYRNDARAGALTANSTTKGARTSDGGASPSSGSGDSTGTTSSPSTVGSSATGSGDSRAGSGSSGTSGTPSPSTAKVAAGAAAS
ncbi:zinc ribbon domain protein [mine drainage metagenome]|uniref:Zinc ribbon domain protein n=1 Tax=mine drainage metagenome TaxID=410659 RepID=A0A1J5QDN4_9ZZZZ